MNIPEQLQNPEFRYCLIKSKSKAPYELGWQLNGYAHNDDKLAQHTSNGGNYGVIGGYGKLRIIDVDTKHPDHEKLAQHINEALNTFTVKTGSGGKHFYITSDYDKNHVFTGGRGELRANEYQVVGPGSTHPNGKTYEIENDKPIRNVPKEELLILLEPILRISPPAFEIKEEKESDTSRSGIEFAEVCRLIRNGKSKEEVWAHMKAFAKWSGAPPQYREVTYEKAKDANTGGIPIETAILQVTNFRDNVQRFHNKQPFFYDSKGFFWFWNHTQKKWGLVDDIDVMLLLDKLLTLSGETVGTGVKSSYMEMFKRIGRDKQPQNAPDHLVQFKDKIYNVQNGQFSEASPELFFTNPIPWGAVTQTQTPVIDKLLTDWCSTAYLPTLKELIAYCCYPGYPIHLIFTLTGTGRNGKTSFLKLLTKFVGVENVCSTELDNLLENRFETFKLYKKLVCTMGETNFAIMEKTSVLKKLTGQDLIGYEAKNKNPFDDYNRAKIVISSNGLPTSTDTSEGFYRRWMIIEFPNEFPEGKDIIDQIPDSEFEALAGQVVEILPRLLENAAFTNQGSITERRERYLAASNPFQLFLKDCCDLTDPNAFVAFGELYDKYKIFLAKHKRRVVSKKELAAVLTQLGIETHFTSKTEEKNGSIQINRAVYVYGIRVAYKVADVTIFPVLPLHIEGNTGKSITSAISLPEFSSFEPPSGQPHGLIEGIPTACVFCGLKRCHYVHKVTKRYYCPSCAESVEKGWEVAK